MSQQLAIWHSGRTYCYVRTPVVRKPCTRGGNTSPVKEVSPFGDVQSCNDAKSETSGHDMVSVIFCFVVRFRRGKQSACACVCNVGALPDATVHAPPRAKHGHYTNLKFEILSLTLKRVLFNACV